MKSIILCEGKTDGILISYFLIRQYGWQYKKANKLRESLPIDHRNEQFNLYTHGTDPSRELSIWSGNGISDIPRKLKSVIERNKVERNPEDRYYRTVIFFDRDEKTEQECETLFRSWFKDADVTFEKAPTLSKWTNGSIELNLKPINKYLQEFLCIVLPPDSNGALETFLLNCLKQASESDRVIVDEANRFIERIPAGHLYLPQRRLRQKACMGSVLSVISPDWVYSDLETRLTQVPWEKLSAASGVYNELGNL